MRKKLFVFTILIIVTISITSCNTNNKKTFDLFERKEQEIALENGISQISEIEIGLDTAGNSLWKRTNQIKYYDDKGLLVKVIRPLYFTKTWAKSSSGLGMTLDEMSYNMRMSETNIPNGKVDTTFYSYDDKENLISIKGKYLTTYKYDEHNNEIEKCISAEYYETVCHSKKYSYNENGDIISRIDSSGARSSSRGRKINIPTNKIFFKYDKEGRIIYDGEFKRIFNDKGQLVKMTDSIEGNKYAFTYDNEGKRVTETFTLIVSKSWDSKNVLTNVKTSTTKKYFYYNEKGLLKQEKQLDENDKLISLKNYEYVFK